MASLDQGELGSSLQAKVRLFVNENAHKLLDQAGDELRFLLITSEAQYLPIDQAPAGLERNELDGGLEIAAEVQVSTAEKCIRCWHYREEVGSNEEHPEICGRCIENVTGPGETRIPDGPMANISSAGVAAGTAITWQPR